MLSPEELWYNQLTNERFRVINLFDIRGERTSINRQNMNHLFSHLVIGLEFRRFERYTIVVDVDVDMHRPIYVRIRT